MKKVSKILTLTFLFILSLSAFVACKKTTAVQLKRPTNVQINDNILSWNKVENASGYIVDVSGDKVSGDQKSTTENKYDLTELTEPSNYSIKVKTLGDGKKYSDSDWSITKEYIVEAKSISEQGLKFELYGSDEEGYEFVGMTATTLKEVDIPSSYNGKPVTSIGVKAFENNVNLSNIILPDTISNISDDAFSGCTALESIDLPNSLVSIGQGVFKGSGLKSIVLPDSVTEIGRNTFSNCAALASVRLPSKLTSIESFAFYKCSALESIELPNTLKFLNSSAFADCGLKSLIIPDSVETMGSAFRQCENLEYVKLPKNIKKIYGSAFYKTPKLKSVDLPSSLETIEDSFFWCSSIETIKIPKKVGSIGKKAFESAAASSVAFEEGSVLSLIDEEAFLNCKNLESIIIPSAVKTIGKDAFKGCANLKSVTIEKNSRLITLDDSFSQTAITEFTIPKSVTKIERSVFYHFTTLEKISFEDNCGVTALSPQMFDGCTNLKTVDFGANSKIETICNSAFKGCNKLTSIEIPQSVKSIENGAFYECSSVKSIIIRSNVENVGSNAFCGWTKNQTIYIEGRTKTPDEWDADWNKGCNANIVWGYVVK